MVLCAFCVGGNHMKTIHLKKEFADDWVSRRAGERMRNLILEATKGGTAVDIDCAGMLIASTSFFDEGIAKLLLEGWTPKDIASRVRFIQLSPLDKKLMEEMIQNRADAS